MLAGPEVTCCLSVSRPPARLARPGMPQTMSYDSLRALPVTSQNGVCRGIDFIERRARGMAATERKLRVHPSRAQCGNYFRIGEVWEGGSVALASISRKSSPDTIPVVLRWVAISWCGFRCSSSRFRAMPSATMRRALTPSASWRSRARSLIAMPRPAEQRLMRGEAGRC